MESTDLHADLLLSETTTISRDERSRTKFPWLSPKVSRISIEETASTPGSGVDGTGATL